MQSPSSLIFLVLLGVWAAYFVQYWIRRRDHLATARSVEQFSAAMRVLERRTPIPRTDLSDPTPRSWAVHPARPTRPQVVVKRAVPVESALPPGRPVRAGVRTAPAATVRPARRLRGAALLLTLLGTLVTVALVGLAVLPVWAPLLAGTALVAALAWVRAGVRAEQAARAARRRRALEEARRRASAPVVASTRRTRPARGGSPTVDAPPARDADPLTVAVGEADVTDRATADVAAPRDEADAAVVTESATERRPEEGAPVVEAAVVEAPPAETEPVVEYVHLVDEDDIPLTWEPVPVPRPTYTMKAKAERPEVPPAQTAPEPAVVPTPLLGHELDERRAAGA